MNKEKQAHPALSREDAHRALDAWIDSNGEMSWNDVQRAACAARDAILAAAKDQAQ